jgi:hypothetical protein
MYGIFTYIWAIFWVNVGKYSIHGASGYEDGRNFFQETWGKHGGFPWIFIQTYGD